MKMEDSLNTFFSHFEELHETVKNIFCKDNREIKSILLCSIIDAISKCVYPKLPNHDKFVFFIEDFSGWEHRDRISLIQLLYYLEDKNDIKYEPLKSFVMDQIGNLSKGTIIQPTFDKCLHELNYLKVIEDEIRKFSYAELLYKYRNAVVHEFKIPGHGMELFSDEDIFYHSMTHFDEAKEIEEETWELVFPTKYISQLVEHSIEHLKKYCQENEIDPFQYYYFGKLWGKK